MSIFDELAKEAADLTAMPDDAKVAMLREKSLELVAADSEVTRLESELEEAKQKLNALAHKELPDLFNQMGVDSFGLPDAGENGADLILSPYYKASIPAEWDEEKKEAAFGHLEQIGGGDLIKTEVKFVLGRGQLDLARTIVAIVRTLADAMFKEGVSQIPQPSISMGVPWNSLTSFVKERTGIEASPDFMVALEQAAEAEAPPPPTMNLQILNATVGQVVKVKERKAKK